MDNNINDFCRVISKINEINKELDKERENFYDGGKSFEECHDDKIKELYKLHDEFSELLICITH